MTLQEGKQQEEPLVRFTNEVALLQELSGGCGLVGVDVDVERSSAEGYAGEIGDLGGLGCGEEHGLSIF